LNRQWTRDKPRPGSGQNRDSAKNNGSILQRFYGMKKLPVRSKYQDFQSALHLLEANETSYANPMSVLEEKNDYRPYQDPSEDETEIRSRFNSTSSLNEQEILPNPTSNFEKPPFNRKTKEYPQQSSSSQTDSLNYNFGRLAPMPEKGPINLAFQSSSSSNTANVYSNGHFSNNSTLNNPTMTPKQKFGSTRLKTSFTDPVSQNRRPALSSSKSFVVTSNKKWNELDTPAFDSDDETRSAWSMVIRNPRLSSRQINSIATPKTELHRNNIRKVMHPDFISNTSTPEITAKPRLSQTMSEGGRPRFVYTSTTKPTPGFRKSLFL